ncbi:hypothetical protein [Paenibacillus ginsengarvi]|uniref:Uncharacterized protein n=1 Tax=Paenibacillus ginsengarvi TaxID=400777 RepID=A0A3B0CT26_9BACL|nr:hypothetical protein [Paenibacillus ginsengarvi]RKN86960.1 hypothetical protein D7M11_03135 [Paenibacillus ginsengarvi]
MKDFIDFLLKNMGFIVVVGGILISLLAKRTREMQRRQGESGEGGKKVNPMMPPFGGGPGPSRDGRQLAAGDKERESRTAREREQPRITVGQAAPSPAVDDRLHPAEPLKPSAAAAHEPETGHGSGERAELELRREDAVRGMIWAELIGPPRSKKPYRPRNR